MDRNLKGLYSNRATDDAVERRLTEIITELNYWLDVAHEGGYRNELITFLDALWLVIDRIGERTIGY